MANARSSDSSNDSYSHTDASCVGASPEAKSEDFPAAQEAVSQATTIVRTADPQEIVTFPPPAEGEFVITLMPPAVDQQAQGTGNQVFSTPSEKLALAWVDRNGTQIIGPTDGYLLSTCHSSALWIPNSWEISVFPAGWTLPHLKAWFDYAIKTAKIGDTPETGPAGVPSSRDLVAHAHIVLRHLALPGSPREPKGPMDRFGCVAELRELLAFVQEFVPPLVCDEHLPTFDNIFECLAYLKRVTPSWPEMGIDWPLVLASAERLWPRSSPTSETPPEEPKAGQELPEFLAGCITDEEIAGADPCSRGFGYASSLLELFQQVQAFCAASLGVGYDLDAIPPGSQKLSPFHALMCMGWPLVSMIQALRDVAEVDFKAITLVNETPIQIGNTFGKNAHDAVFRLANEICEVITSATDGKLSVKSFTSEPQGTLEEAWAKACGAIEGRLPDSLTAKRLQIQLETESRRAFVQNFAPAKATNHHTPEPPNLFHRSGKVWQLRFNGVDATELLTDVNGLRYIAELLSRPGKESNVAILWLSISGHALRHSRGEPLVDKEAHQAYCKRDRELREDLSVAEMKNDHTLISQITNKRHQLEQHVLQVTGLGTSTRKTGDESNNLRRAVCKCIKEAIEKIATVHELLARHLNSSIRTGSIVSYAPDEPISWNL